MLIQWESGQGQQDETAEHSYDMSVSICRAVDVSALKFDSLSHPEDSFASALWKFLAGCVLFSPDTVSMGCECLLHRCCRAIRSTCRFYGGCSRWDHHVILSHQLVIDG